MEKRYPIDSSDFRYMMEEGYVYVDKTEHVYNMTRDKYVFLARPRRFGKTMLSKTIMHYFKGRKELFSNLKISKLEKDWVEYPTFRFDMSSYKDSAPEDLREGIAFMLECCENELGYCRPELKNSSRFRYLIETAFKQTGKRTVIIIDEYDAPLLNHLHDGRLEEYRTILQEFYQQLKVCEDSLRFVFITGITKFSQLSIFSTINNLNVISMDDNYSDVCGISKDELLTQFQEEIQMLADKENISFDDMVGRLKYMYDGYRFSENSKEIFNPLSLMYVFKKEKISYYWFQTATPTFIIKHLEHFGVDPIELEGFALKQRQFDVSAEDVNSVWPLLYQSGYCTIKSYDQDSMAFNMGIPNKEVEIGLMHNIALSYLKRTSDDVEDLLHDIYMGIKDGDVDKAMTALRDFMVDIPYDLENKKEVHFETILYVIFKSLGYYTKVEVKNCKGRLDLIIFCKKYIYIFELKVDGSTADALDQIDRMKYAVPYEKDGRPIIKVGVNIDSKERTIGEWEVRR